MNWDRIEGNWKELKGDVMQRWDWLTDDQVALRLYAGTMGKRRPPRAVFPSTSTRRTRK